MQVEAWSRPVIYNRIATIGETAVNEELEVSIEFASRKQTAEAAIAKQ
jgi:hypothetical protein